MNARNFFPSNRILFVVTIFCTISIASTDEGTIGKETTGMEATRKVAVDQVTTIEEETIGVEATGKETVDRVITGEETTGKETTGMEATRKVTVDQVTIGKEIIGEEAIGKGTIREAAIQEKTTGQETIDQEIIDEEMITDLDLIIDHNVVARFGEFKAKRSEEETLPKLPASTKNKICQKIFGSPYFEDGSWIDPDQEEVRNLLAKDYPELFETIYEKENEYEEYLWSFFRVSGYIRAFTCLTWYQVEIMRHCVSEVHHLTLNREGDSDEPPVKLVGRLVFYSTNQLYLEAFAADGSHVTVDNENFVVESGTDFATLKAKPVK